MKLPLNCEVNYFADFLTQEESRALYAVLMEKYKIDQARIIINAGGKMIKTDSFKILFASKRLIERNTHPEEIHGKSYVWNGLMNELKERIQDFLHMEFELAMCLYYPDGNYFAPYHSDQETSGVHTVLPSISLGEVRAFSFCDKNSNETFDLDLANGSLLVMGTHCQSRYTHSLLQNSNYKKGRINITFREASFQ
ncbi:MAG: alpha-ketoglutarate-dependent dioxygenase AlkB [Marinirhabdus sp.]|nr:alpha-ketoglutarate-dependent dioxygenase AlkB [Marinirhabdus sp.]